MLQPTSASRCSHCNKITPVGLKRCSACQPGTPTARYYCSTECQKLDWKAGHREICEAAKKQRETLTAVPTWGIRLSFLASLFDAEEVKDLTTEEVVEGFLARMTTNPQSPFGGDSLVEYIMRSRPEWRTHVKPLADSFVCHVWQYKWSDTISALLEAEKEDPDRFIWIDVAVLNQHALGSALAFSNTTVLMMSSVDPKEQVEERLENMETLIERIRKFELVCSSPSPAMRPVPAQRSWCVWETLYARDESIPIEIRIPRRERDVLVGNILRRTTDFVSLSTFRKTFSLINVERAQARDPREQETIMADLVENSISRVNGVIREIMWQWISTLTSEAMRRAGVAEDKEKLMNVHIVKAAAAAAWKAWKQSKASASAALEIARELYPNSDAEPLGTALHLLASASFQGKEHNAAHPLFMECVSVMRKDSVLGEDHLDLASYFLEAAANARMINKNAEARKLYEDALRVLSKVYGQYHPHVAKVALELVDILKGLGDRLSAANWLSVTVEVKSRIYGASHPHMAPPLMLLGTLWKEVGRYDEAILTTRRALTIIRASRGSDHLSAGDACASLADAHLKLSMLKDMDGDDGDEDNVKAKEYAREAIRVYEKCLGVNDEKVRRMRKLWEIQDDLHSPEEVDNVVIRTLEEKVEGRHTPKTTEKQGERKKKR